MAEEVSRTATCSGCGAPLQSDYQGPCPSCGRAAGKTVQIGLAEEINIASSLSWEKRREEVRKDPTIYYGLWLVTLLSPLLGFAFGGVAGVVVGLVVGVASQWLGTYAVTRHTEIERGTG